MRKMAMAVLVVAGLALAGAGAHGADEKVMVGFAQTGAESGWRTAHTQSMKSEAVKRGVDMKFSDGQGKQENQIRALRSFVAQGVDVIILSPLVETGWEPVLKEAKRARIPVILLDRRISVGDDSLYTTFIGSDFVEEGRMAGRWLVKKVDNKAKIVELQGTPGSAPAIDRRAGFLEIVKEHPGMEIMESQSGDFRRSKGKEVMEAFLKKHGEAIDVLYAHNDDMAIGAIQAIEEAGMKPGEDIIIVSVDALKVAFEAMVQGKLNCTIECNPLLGPAAFDAVEKLLAGETLPKKMLVHDETFDQSVAAELIDSRKY
jgi:ABC-type sugar transport system substrate-binding protein